MRGPGAPGPDARGAGRRRGDETLRARLERQHLGQRGLRLALQHDARLGGVPRGGLCALAAVDRVAERQLEIALGHGVTGLHERGPRPGEIVRREALGAGRNGDFDGGLRLIDFLGRGFGAAGGCATKRQHGAEPRGSARTRRRQEHQIFEYRRMRDLAPHDRPREKLERLGAGALGDNELLALVLACGSAARDALTLANDLLDRFGGLRGLTRAAADDLQLVRGVGLARAAQVLAAVELGRRTLVREAAERPRLGTPRQIAALLLPQYGARQVEHFGLVMLDTKHRMLRVRIVSIGCLDSTVVHPREVFREAAAASAAAIVLFHNHPSGDPAPSPDDVALTARMVRAGAIMGIDVLDHVILADQRYFSFAESGQLPAGVTGRTAADATERAG